MKKLFTNKLFYTIIGAIAGFLYWKFDGCTSGSCAIRQDWFLSTMWGAMIGWMVSGLFLGCGCYGNSCDITNKSDSNNNNKTEEK
ncbi:MAG: hypothetical protein Q8909_04765 [Bacteroidota bacterium]|nr:hypothetical protein [Bacteroidota bacterium]